MANLEIHYADGGHGGPYRDFPAAIREALHGLLQAGDVFITLGAGNIWTVGQQYLEGR